MLSITVQERGNDMHVAVPNWAGLFITLFISPFSAQFYNILNTSPFPPHIKTTLSSVIMATATDIILKSNVNMEFTPDIINMAAVKLQPTFVSSVNSQILHLFFMY